MSEGTCEVDFGDFSDEADPVEFHDSKRSKARKPHTCDECGGPIAVGETYQRTAYKFEGSFACERRCSACCEAADEFHCYVLGGELWTMFREEWEQGAHLQSCLNRLTTARAKEHMRQQWLKWQESKAKKRTADHP